VTALYSFRMYFLVFHGKPRMDEHTRHHLHETPWVVTVPLILLAIPSVVLGWMVVEPLLVTDWFAPGLESDRGGPRARYPAAAARALARPVGLRPARHDAALLPGHGRAGLAASSGGSPLPRTRRSTSSCRRWAVPSPRALQASTGSTTSIRRSSPAAVVGWASASGSRRRSRHHRRCHRQRLGPSVAALAQRARHLQTGYLYHYAIAMIVGLVGLLTFFVVL
jgi:NADH-quinone oxidoreductase subunit L